jgi:hypothetical protein
MSSCSATPVLGISLLGWKGWGRAGNVGNLGKVGFGKLKFKSRWRIPFDRKRTILAIKGYPMEYVDYLESKFYYISI